MTDDAAQRGRTHRHGWRAGVVVLVSAIWAIVPIGTAAYLLHQSSLVELPSEQQVWEPIRPAPSSVEEQSGLALTWSPPADIIAPAWSGIVQSVGIETGGALDSGVTVAKIGGIQRLAYASAEPFSRSLSVDDRGTDVADLNRLLASRELNHAGGDYFTWETRLGVQKLAESLGAGRNVTTFDPSWVIYLSAPVSIETVDLVVGAPAPTEGTVIATGYPRLSAATLTTFSAAKDLLSDEQAATPEAVPLPDDAALVLDDQELVLAADRASVAPESLPAVEAVVSQGARAIVVKTRIPGVEGWSVPSVAVYVDAAGSSCVLVRTDGDTRAVLVTLASTGDQTAIVSGALSPGDDIATNPSLDPQSCS